jgi:putative membrane protein
VGVATGGIAPKLVGEARWAYVGLGCGFALIGALVLAYGYRRHTAVERALARGEFAYPDDRMLLFSAAAGALGVLTAILLLFSL